MTHTTLPHHPLPPRGALSVEEFLQWASISRWLFYRLVKQGAIRPKKVCGRTVIPVEEAERWLRDLPELTASSRPQE